MLEGADKERGTKRYRPVIMDFGLAREQHEGKGLTATGTMMGTPAYMPPEQARGETDLIDRRSDVYSLGATLYELLAGRPPFDGSSMVDILFKVMNHQPQALRSVLTNIPEPLETIVSKCLHKEPFRRYPTAQALAEDLERFLRGEPIQGKRLSAVHQLSWQAKRNKPVTSLLLLLTALVIGTFAYFMQVRARRLEAELLAKQQDEEHQLVAQEVEQILWLTRLMYTLPLHDITKQKEQLRSSLKVIAKNTLTDSTRLSARNRYALGRCYFALHDLHLAKKYFDEAQKAGLSSAEYNFAQFRLLDSLYRKELEKTERKDSSKKTGKEDADAAVAATEDFKARKDQIEAEFSQKIQPYLGNIQELPTLSNYYLKALIEYYNHNYNQAIENAFKAEQEVPWFYESAQLAGDIYNSVAIDNLTRNKLNEAESNFRSAIQCYERAINIARSDPQLYESLANVRNSLMGIEIFHLTDPDISRKKAVEAAESINQILPSEGRANIQIAQSYIIYGRFLQTTSSTNLKERLDATQKAISAGEQASLMFKTKNRGHDFSGASSSIASFNELEANRLTAEALMQKVSVLNQKEKNSDEVASALGQADSILSEAVKANQNDLSLYTSMLNLRRLQAQRLQKQGKDPTDIIDDATKHIVPPGLNIGQSEYLTQRLLLYLILARYNLDHGKSSEKLIHDAQELISSFQKTKDYRAQTILGSLFCIQASYCLDAHCNVDEPRVEAQRFAEESKINSNKNWFRPYVVSVWAYAINAMSIYQNKQSPLEITKLGRNAARECLERINDSSCYAHLATLELADAYWYLSQRKNVDGLLKSAQAAAEAAVDRASETQKYDALFALARVHYLAVQSLFAERAPPRKRLIDAIGKGLEVVEKALTNRRDKPQALALKGALLFRRGKLAKTAVERLKFLQQAHQAFKAAKNNPLQENLYAHEVAETTVLLERAGARPDSATASY